MLLVAILTFGAWIEYFNPGLIREKIQELKASFGSEQSW